MAVEVKSIGTRIGKSGFGEKADGSGGWVEEISPALPVGEDAAAVRGLEVVLWATGVIAPPL